MIQYVVRRAFKTNGVFYPVGTLVSEEMDIKLFRTKCRENKIVLLETEDEALQEQKEFFELKLGVTIDTPKAAEISTGVKVAGTPVAKAKETEKPTTGTPEVKKVLPTATKAKGTAK